MALISPGIKREYREEMEIETPKRKRRKDHPISPLARFKWIEEDDEDENKK